MAYCAESGKQDAWMGLEGLSVYLLFTLVTTWLTAHHQCPATRESTRPHSDSLGKPNMQTVISTECGSLSHYQKVQNFFANYGFY